MTLQLVLFAAIWPLLAADSAFAPAADRIRPNGISGTLVIVGGGSIPDSVVKAFAEQAGPADKAKLVVIPTASESADSPSHDDTIKLWNDRGFAHVAVLHTRDRKRADDPEFIAPLKEATAVWFGGGDQSRIADAYLGTAVERELFALLKRGGVIGGTSAGAAIQSRVMIAGGNPKPEIGKGLDLLPGAIIDQHFLKRERKPRLLDAVARHPGLFGLGIDESTAVVVQGRTLKVVGKSSAIVILGASAQRPAQEIELKPGEAADLTAIRRAALARSQPPFPPETLREPKLESGSLVIVGGGGMPKDVVAEFIKRAGGPDALIVVLPTASEPPLGFVVGDRVDPGTGDIRLFRSAGAKNVKALAARDPEEMAKPEVLETLKQAKGVWFGGGRQWRFVDAYENTPACQAFHDVLKRGGVIGGSSAGASIQAEYLVRGHPLGNFEMMAEGYEQGFAFLPGTAIDQHLSQRGRLKDMPKVIEAFPQLLGIGIDEATALIVENNVGTVMGRGRVFFFDRRDPNTPQAFKAGERFDLVKRAPQK